MEIYVEITWGRDEVVPDLVLVEKLVNEMVGPNDKKTIHYGCFSKQAKWQSSDTPQITEFIRREVGPSAR